MATKRTATREAESTPPEKRPRRRSERVKNKKEGGVIRSPWRSPEEKASKPSPAASKQVAVVKKDKKKSKAIVERGKSSDAVATQSTSGEEESNVIYIGHVPHGFYEHQMRGYFAQFGDVTKVKLSRSKTSGKSKGYAFVEFESSEVAKIAAEAMHDYLMFGQKLVCNLVPLEDLHPHTFKGSNQRFKKIPWRKIESERNNKERTAEEETRRIKKLATKDSKRQKKIKAAGIDYDFQGYVSKTSSAKKKAPKATKAKRKSKAKK